jgi:hypothetical protein
MAMLTNSFLDDVVKIVYAEYKALGGDDKAAKGPDLGNNLRTKMVARFSPQKIAK